jgi:hypothetical protein
MEIQCGFLLASISAIVIHQVAVCSRFSSPVSFYSLTNIGQFVRLFPAPDLIDILPPPIWLDFHWIKPPLNWCDYNWILSAGLDGGNSPLPILILPSFFTTQIPYYTLPIWQVHLRLKILSTPTSRLPDFCSKLYTCTVWSAATSGSPVFLGFISDSLGFLPSSVWSPDVNGPRLTYDLLFIIHTTHCLLP